VALAGEISRHFRSITQESGGLDTMRTSRVKSSAEPIQSIVTLFLRMINFRKFQFA
jgi:hypothetical protein